MDNQKILDRFDVLYNNILSDQAPGLDAYEKSVFFNKAQLEVLKNHLNPKGNKYVEGFDGSPKRQLDFSNLTVDGIYYTDIYELVDKPNGSFCQNGYKFPIVHYEPQYQGSGDNKIHKLDDDDNWVHEEVDEFDKILYIINENVDVIKVDEVEIIKKILTSFMEGTYLAYDVNNDNEIELTDVTGIISQYLSSDNPIIKDAVNKVIYLAVNGPYVPGESIKGTYTLMDAFNEYMSDAVRLTIVPINNVEYDTLMSRPYKYPSHSQAWRIFVNKMAEITVPSDYIPIRYRIRYIRVPQEVDLTNASNSDCELPDFLIDEVLQRAVELAKNAWEGNVETTKAFGERSE